VYDVKVDRVIPDADLDRLREGIMLEGKKTRPATILRLAPKKLRITLREGRNRQVRKMCAAVGAKVEELVRTSFAGILLGRLAVGSWRYLTDKEVRILGT
jgi:pseudouridine synthase